MKLNITKTLAVLLTSVALTACGGGNDKTAKNESKSADKGPKGNLTYCISSIEHHNAPAKTTTVETSIVVQRVYQTLYGLKQGTTELEPKLATSHEVSDDGLEYTYHLRHGVKFGKTKYFTPTRDMNADDVIFSVKRQLDKSNAFYSTGYVYIHSMGFDKAIKDVVKVDDYTVKFVLNKPMAIFHPSMNMDVFAVLSKEYADQVEKSGQIDDLFNKPVGTGPWAFVGQKDGEYKRFMANSDYWGNKPHFKTLVMKMIAESNQLLNGVEVGECDMTGLLSVTSVKDAANMQNVDVIKMPALNTAYIMINTKGKKALGNKLVRQAIEYAIDRQRLIDEASQGFGIIAHDLVPKAMFGNHENDVPGREYNIEKAKELLAKAGYPGGKGIPELNLVTHSGSAVHRTTAVIIQHNLKKIGINVKISTLEWHTSLQALMKGDYDLGPLSWSADYIDPDDYYMNIVGPNNDGNWTNWYDKDFQKTIKKAQVIADMKERDELYLKAAKMMHENVPLIVTYDTYNVISHRKELKGVVSSPAFHFDLTSVYK